ncbi:hypothetical protein NP493_214g00022 [Ridgeia piscesae]|uniref:Leucine-rich repeat-containing protein 71-like n=1 Tax=Ridgeia piscesae TaxID=27915 RepID=A0AAD9P0X3_RIDPI|nr:hypothetical protein NP493_214g00022 [Ridgeia piscesae]
MGKRIEKAFAKDGKVQSASGPQSAHEDDPNRTPEPHVCTGHFHTDFTELCKRSGMVVIPTVVPRPRRPPSPQPVAVIEEKTKPGRKDDKKNAPPPPPEPEPETDLTENGEPKEPPPKTYTMKDKFEYFKPCVQVEMDNPDKQETVTEVFIRGWRVDVPMINIFKQCWPKMDKLHSITLWNTGLTDETLEILASIIPMCANLRNLSVEGSPVKSEAFHLLMKEESPVQHLSLRYNGITDIGAEHLGKALGTVQFQNMKLLTLNLNGNKITDKGVQFFATALRTNRTLLCLGLASNQISDKGAISLSKIFSQFPLTHEEILERRKLLSEKGGLEHQKSAMSPTNRRGDSRDRADRPGSVRSSHTTGGKPGKSAKNKKDGKTAADEKHDKTKGKKEQQDKTTKRASVVADTKSAAKKGAQTTKGVRTKVPSQQDTEHSIISSESTDSHEVINPLLDMVEHLDNGVIILSGNMTLISLNLAYNKIGEEGVKALWLAIGYQSSLALFNNKSGGGLMRLNLNKNNISKDSDSLQKLNAKMQMKDPFYQPPIHSPDQESLKSKA